MVQTLSKRLTKSDWLSAGLKAVAEAGPEALKAEPLARRLGTSKGSFYWHFSDVPAFHAALLAEWEAQARADIATALATQNSPTARLRHLGQMIATKSTGQAIDPAIRAWSRGNARAALSVERVDLQRLDAIRDLLGQLDIANPEMSRILYAAAIGMQGTGPAEPGDNADAIGSLVDLVLALR